MAKGKRGSSRKSSRGSAAVVWAVAALVILAVAAMFLFKDSQGSSRSPDPPSSESGGGVPAAVMRDVTQVPAATIDSAGAGGPDVGVPSRLPGGTPALSSGGKPEIVYVGAEYCPFCASQRWPLVQALSRFGTFSGLSAGESSAVDVYPSTPTFSFHGSSFESPYLVFTPVETATNEVQGNGYTPLERLTPAQERLLGTYDAPPYVPAASAGAIPFLDIGGRYLQSGASVSPELLQGKSLEQIAGALADPSDRLSGTIVGSANLMTAAICDATGGVPAEVCTAPAVEVAAKRLAVGT